VFILEFPELFESLLLLSNGLLEKSLTESISILGADTEVATHLMRRGVTRAKSLPEGRGGKNQPDPALARGEFFQPTLILAPDNKKRVAQEEIFGPVAVVIKFKDEADVIKMANDSDYGLGGAVWTYNINRALRVARALETGRVWVNCYNRLPAGAPFGGYKTSGIGRETHKMMLDAYTQVKNIFISTREEREGMY